MSRRKQSNPQHLGLDDEEEQGTTMTRIESPRLGMGDYEQTTDMGELCQLAAPEVDDFRPPGERATTGGLVHHHDHRQLNPSEMDHPVDYDNEQDFSEDSLSDDEVDDDELGNIAEHRTASDDDCKDDYRDDYDVTGPNDDLSSVSNITLGPLRHTKHAVAQFAENNIAPSEAAMIHSTLYSLQQQQILQLYLIQQLHQHLMQGTVPNFPPSWLPLPMTSLPALTSSSTTSSAVTPPRHVTSTTSGANDYTMTTSSTRVPTFRSHLAELETMTNKPQVTSLEEEKMKSGKFDRTFDGLNRSSSTDEPYFKHRCRYCHKVFGSESALQIHIRSHTGERPFKCNICGNRFTTRGNLKVHFSRHQSKYPHISMNPNPVPEHLDKILPPPISAIAPLPPATSVAAPTATSSVPTEAASVVVTMASEPLQTEPLALTPPIRSPSNQELKMSPGRLSPISVEVSRAQTPEEEDGEACVAPVVPVPLPTTLPQFTPSYDVAAFMNSRPMPPKYEDPLEQFMEFDKSETTKLAQLVENLEHKMTDPNECVICHRVLSCKSALQMHYRTHTGERPFRCKICGRSFTTKGNLKTHMGVHRAKPPVRMLHQCPVCHKQFTNSIVLQQHIRMHTPDMAGLDLATKLGTYPSQFIIPRPFTGSAPPTPMGLDLSKYGCDEQVETQRRKDDSSEESNTQSSPEANEPAVKKARYEDEISMNYEPRVERSESVDGDSKGQYNSLADLEERVQMMSRRFSPQDQQPLDMTLVKYGYYNRSRSNSMNSQNSENEDSSNGSQRNSSSPFLYRTSSPGSSFGALDLSQTDRHTICHFCNKSFACRSALEIHYRSHTKERPFECHVCHRGFTTRGNMRQHLHTHKIRDMTGDYQYEDREIKQEKPEIKPESDNNNTPNKFLSPPSSSSYITSAPSTPISSTLTPTSSASPFLRRPNSHKHFCTICQKPFSSASALQIHMRTHTGDKPYKCTVCGKAFTTKGNLKVHMGTHMWNNGPSRRGRRIAMDSPLPISAKDTEFMFAHRNPDLYFPYPTFSTGFAPKYNNEIPVIQSMNGSFPHYTTPVNAPDYMKMSAGFSPQMPHDAILKNYSVVTGESLKDSPVRNNNEGEADRSVSDENHSDQSPPTRDSVWSWKTTCHLCSKVCVNVAALELHLQSHILKRDEQPKPLLA